MSSQYREPVRALIPTFCLFKLALSLDIWMIMKSERLNWNQRGLTYGKTFVRADVASNW